MPRRRSRSTAKTRDFSRIADYVIEASWLVGLLTVPLFLNPRGWLTFYNEPKYFALHLVALVILTAWSWERALFARPAGLPGLSECREWIGRRPERWALVAAGALGATAILSTIASPVKLVSLWGRDYVDLGYELYSFLAFLVIFFAVALRVRSEARLRRALWMIVAVGTIAAMYGMGQRHGWDPIGSGEGAARIAASFGNPIHFGSFLVMTTVLTPAVALVEGRNGKYVWLAVGALALGVQLAALWYTGSRGPWVGYAVGAIAFTALGLLWLRRRDLLKGLGVMGAAVIVALLLGQIPLPEGEGGGERNLADVGRIFEETTSGSVGGRGLIWESALDLGVDRTWSPQEPAAAGLVRALLGYGPDTFFYAYPLGVDVDHSGSIAKHTHNYPLQLFMELGLLGLVSVVALAVLTLHAAVRLLNVLKQPGSNDAFGTIVIVGLLAALAGRSIEQMAGVARLGDLLPFWVLLGLLVAAIEVFAVSAGRTGEVVPGGGRPRPGPGTQIKWGYMIGALLVTVIGAGLFYWRDVKMIQASAIARDGAVLGHDGRVNEALAKYQEAADLNPHVEQFHLVINDLLRDAADKEEKSGNRDLAIFGWETALNAARRYADLNPKAFDTQGRVGQAESRLVGLGVDQYADSAKATYINFAEARPSYPAVQSSAAQGFLAIGDDVLGLAYANRALEMETPEHPDPRSWWFRGVALENLGEYEAAVASYLNAVQRAPESVYALNAHDRLVVVYGLLGEPEKAAEQQVFADQFIR